MVAVSPLPDFATPVTFDESLNAMPCLASRRWNALAMSRSMPGMMRSRNSTTVTSAPSRRHTEPSSRPITPAPTTSSLPGTVSSVSAPVDETICFSSMVTPRSGATSEPVAMTMLLVSSVCVLPSSALTSTLPGAAMRPMPRTVSTLFFLSRKATPLTLPATPSSLSFIIVGRSRVGVPTPMPMRAKECPASSNISEACSSALDGMQPMLRQVPPKVAFFSTTAVLSPSCAARIAHT